MTVYADTSFLFSLYVSDANSAAAVATMGRFKQTLHTTDFGAFEFTNAVGWRVFRKMFSLTQHRGVLASFSADVQAGVVHILPIPTAAFGAALQIAKTHTPTLGIRALDVLHVASALVLKADTFFTFDQKQAHLGSTLGLRLR